MASEQLNKVLEDNPVGAGGQARHHGRADAWCDGKGIGARGPRRYVRADRRGWGQGRMDRARPTRPTIALFSICTAAAM